MVSHVNCHSREAWRSPDGFAFGGAYASREYLRLIAANELVMTELILCTEERCGMLASSIWRL